MRASNLRITAMMLLLPIGASAANLALPEPGYLVVDGAYHVFDLPQVGDVRIPAELHPLNAEGFFLLSVVAMTACNSGDGPQTLLLSETLGDPTAPRLTLAADANQLASISLTACDGAVVMFARSTTGTTTCDGAVGFPFRRGQCAAVDVTDPGNVFFDTFGQ